jgi:hypothetical protein
MRVGTKDGGDGVRCWNKEAVTAYVDQVNAREALVDRNNPDVVVLPGQLICYGCEVMEFDYGVKCTAVLTRTRYAVEGEIPPRPEDAVGSLRDIVGLRSRAPEEVVASVAAPSLAASGSSTGTSSASTPSGAAQPAASSPPQPDGKRGGIRGLLRR